MRATKKLSWLNLGIKSGGKPLVRFLLRDVENYERAMRQAPLTAKIPDVAT
jgi:hypothetical protein